MQWSAWARPALRLSDVPWECQMWGHPSTPCSDQPPPTPKVTVGRTVNIASYTVRKEHTHKSIYSSSQKSFHRHLIKKQQHKGITFFGRDSSQPPQSTLPTQQLSSNEGEVMSIGLRRMVMPNVRPGCYSEPMLSAGLAYFWLHKTRGGDEPQKNLRAFPFEYKCYFSPDVS